MRLKTNIGKVVNPLALVYQAYWLIWWHKSFLDTFMFHFPTSQKAPQSYSDEALHLCPISLLEMTELKTRYPRSGLQKILQLKDRHTETEFWPVVLMLEDKRLIVLILSILVIQYYSIEYTRMLCFDCKIMKWICNVHFRTIVIIIKLQMEHYLGIISH